MQVSLSWNLATREVTEMELDAIVDRMRNNQKLFDRTNEYRWMLATGQKDDIKKFKRQHFPAFAPNALLYEGKARDNVVGLTDMCFLDIDHVDDMMLLDYALAILRQDKHVVLACKSVSGNGIHILIRYKEKGRKYPPNRTQMKPLSMRKWYKKVFDCLVKEYQWKLGLEIDKQPNNIECMCLIASDSNAYYNPDAEPIVLTVGQEKAAIFVSDDIRQSAMI